MTDRIKHLLPAVVLGFIVLGLIVWYMMRVPAPEPSFNAPSSSVSAEPAKIAEEATYYTVDALYPTETALRGSAGVQADTDAIAAMKTFVEQEIAKFKDNGDFANLSHDDVQMLGLDQRKYALGIEYKIYESAATLSYVYQMYTDTGGAHPNTYYRTFTFNKKSGTALHMEELFAESAPYLETLSTIARAKLPALLAERSSIEVSEVDTDYIASGTLPVEDSFQNFYLDGKNLVLVFPPYQVGPYVLGMIELPIQTSELAGLAPEYTK